ncbi:hypothetical protein BDP81DRAFT_388211 [Colletotrichum phormii]|uniref:Uncharacterized protein n=1 Tax=Colletotrichum phormii TaxID=359342 RepID=A0AAJ0ENA2_9PEZI|nr:uncharacterized protein BDP81DRAFT_388211 [Colletotrichum phormii]KAK1655263.1 hypothetical protein BDP81DRAFT_388211 [Colletotrichum phormii]
MPPKKGTAKPPTAAEIAAAEATAAVVPCIAGKKGDTWNKFEDRIEAITKQTIAAGLDNAVPPLTKEELDAILPETLPDSAFTSDWTRDEEAALQQAMPKNFKVLVRLFNASPFEIISPKYRLEWETNAKDAVGPHWSVKFTSRIATIAIHPLWQRDVKLLTLALQYAVILRTQDTLPWLFSRPDDTLFFKTFEKVIGEMRDTPIAEVHEEVRSRLKRDRQVIPIFSEFLLSLETIQESSPNTTIQDRSKRVYPVGVVDAKAVIDALDATDDLGLRGLPSIEVYTSAEFRPEVEAQPALEVTENEQINQDQENAGLEAKVQQLEEENRQLRRQQKKNEHKLRKYKRQKKRQLKENGRLKDKLQLQKQHSQPQIIKQEAALPEAESTTAVDESVKNLFKDAIKDVDEANERRHQEIMKSISELRQTHAEPSRKRARSNSQGAFHTSDHDAPRHDLHQ